MREVIHVLATFESKDALLAAMKGAASWVTISDAEALSLATRDPPDPYASKELRPGLNFTYLGKGEEGLRRAEGLQAQMERGEVTEAHNDRLSPPTAENDHG